MEMELRRNIAELENSYAAEDLAAEVALEERMVTAGRDQFRKQIANAREKGSESQTKYGQTLISRSVAPLAEAVVAFLDKANGGGAGRRHIAAKYLSQLDPEVSAFILMRSVVDSLTGKRQLLQRTAITVASRIEDEVRFAQFEEAAAVAKQKAIFTKAQEKAKKGTSYHRKKSTMAGYERRFTEKEWAPWPEQDKLHIGMLLLGMAIDAGYVTIGTEVVSRRDTRKTLEPTQKVVDWIERDGAQSELLNPVHLPMCVEPLPWSDPYNGGYLTKLAQGRHALVKTGNLNYLTEMADSEMPAV